MMSPLKLILEAIQHDTGTSVRRGTSNLHGENTTHTTTAITRLTVVGFAAVLAPSACGSNDDSNDATADPANVDAPAEEIAADAAAACKEGNALFSSADTTRAGPHQAPSTEPIALAPTPPPDPG
ncbi:MAG: hypothetical protein ACI8RC_001783 [Ilumatobacter sp.]|jgi:hypothetical protein